MSPDVAIPAVFLLIIAGMRFATPPPAARPTPEGLPKALGTLLNWFRVDPPSLEIFRPVRANTTRLQFHACRLIYAGICAGFFILLIAVPSVGADVIGFAREQLEATPLGSEFAVSGGPTTVAIVLLLLFSYVPPFRGLDLSLRRWLYERARIPAEQLALQRQLRRSLFRPDPDALEAVRRTLVNSGFRAEDLAYDPEPTPRSMWTKAAVLCHVAKKDLIDPRLGPSILHCAQQVEAKFEELRPEVSGRLARLEALPEGPDRQRAYEELRTLCKQLLDAGYEVLSRAVLVLHGSERERARALRRLGFLVAPKAYSPVPDANGILVIVLLLGLVIAVPLAMIRRPGVALGVLLVTLFSVAMPVLLARVLPEHETRRAARKPGETPPLLFPTLSALAAAAAALLPGLFVFSRAETIGEAWQEFLRVKLPWLLIPATLAGTLAWLLSGKQPRLDEIRLRAEGEGLAGLRSEGGILAVAAMAAYAIACPWVMAGAQAAGDGEPDLVAAILAMWPWRLLAGIVLGLGAGVIGFLVPTWFRVSRQREARKGRERMLRLVVPELPAGRFAVVEDPEMGVDVQVSSEWVEAKLPPDGLLAVKCLSDFEDAVLQHAETSSGAPIEIEGLDEDRPGKRMLRPCGRSGPDKLLYVIGTREDAMHCHEEKQRRSLEELLAA